MNEIPQIEDAQERDWLKAQIDQGNISGTQLEVVTEAIRRFEQKGIDANETSEAAAARAAETEANKQEQAETRVKNHIEMQNEAMGHFMNNLVLDQESRLQMALEASNPDNIPGYAAMTSEQKDEAVQNNLWRSLNPVQKFLIGMDQVNTEIGDLISRAWSSDEEIKERKAEKAVFDMASAKEGFGPEDVGNVMALASIVSVPGGGLGAIFKGTAMLVKEGAKKKADMMAEAFMGISKKFGEEVADAAIEQAMKNPGFKNLFKAYGNKAVDEQKAAQIVKGMTQYVESAAKPLDAAAKAAARRKAAQGQAAERIFKGYKGDAAKLQDDVLKQNAFIKKEAMERTLGVKGSGKRYQQRKNKEALYRHERITKGGY